ncbi:MAG: glutathione synthase, partial [Pseudomonadota bacterium]
MGLDVAFQMDDIRGVDIRADSTFRLALEAEARGHRLFYYHAPDLVWSEGRVTARGRRISLRADADDPVTFGEPETRDLADLDVVWLRQDPPFDM